jgi:hypothetical protein
LLIVHLAPQFDKKLKCFSESERTTRQMLHQPVELARLSGKWLGATAQFPCPLFSVLLL